MAQTYLNKKQELFAQFVAGGETYTRSYELAGYEPSSSNAHNLANKEIVAKRIEELKEEYGRKEAEFKVLRQKAEEADPEFAEDIIRGVEWSFQRIMDMMGENVRLAQIAGEYKAANEGLKMMAEAMNMFASAKVKGDEKGGTTNNVLALVGEATKLLAAGNGGGAAEQTDEDDNPLRPRAPKKDG